MADWATLFSRPANKSGGSGEMGFIHGLIDFLVMWPMAWVGGSRLYPIAKPVQCPEPETPKPYNPYELTPDSPVGTEAALQSLEAKRMRTAWLDEVLQNALLQMRRKGANAWMGKGEGI